MDNRYICQFINSKDIRQYLDEINYEFSVPEYAYLIWQCRLISIKDRHQEWQNLIDSTENCAVLTNGGQNQWYLHDAIRKYITFENQLIERLMRPNENAFYEGIWQEDRIWTGDDGWHGGNCYFESYEEAFSYAKEYANEESVYCFKIKKNYIDNSPNHSAIIEALFTPDGEMMDIDYWGETETLWKESDSDIWFESFDEMWFDIPIPFKPGDIVCDYRKQSPFVLTDTTQWFKKEKPGKRENWKQYLTHMDMNASGYAYEGTTKTVRWDWCDYYYLNLEYYTNELKDGERVLAAYSQFKQGKINGDTLNKLCQIITYEANAASQYDAIDYMFEQNDKAIFGFSSYERKKDYDK